MQWNEIKLAIAGESPGAAPLFEMGEGGLDDDDVVVGRFSLLALYIIAE